MNYFELSFECYCSNWSFIFSNKVSLEAFLIDLLLLLCQWPDMEKKYLKRQSQNQEDICHECKQDNIIRKQNSFPRLNCTLRHFFITALSEIAKNDSIQLPNQPYSWLILCLFKWGFLSIFSSPNPRATNANEHHVSFLFFYSTFYYSHSGFRGTNHFPFYFLLPRALPSFDYHLRDVFQSRTTSVKGCVTFEIFVSSHRSMSWRPCHAVMRSSQSKTASSSLFALIQSEKNIFGNGTEIKACLGLSPRFCWWFPEETYATTSSEACPDNHA